MEDNTHVPPRFDARASTIWGVRASAFLLLQFTGLGHISEREHPSYTQNRMAFLIKPILRGSRLDWHIHRTRLITKKQLKHGLLLCSVCCLPTVACVATLTLPNLHGNFLPVSHRFIVLALPDHILALSYVFGHVRGEEHPQLPPTHNGIPRTGAERVYVYGRSRTLGTDQKPPLIGTGRVAQVVNSYSHK